MVHLKNTGVSSISFIIGQLSLGGSEKQLFLLIKELNKLGWKISVITLNAVKDDFWEKPLRELGVTLHRIPESRMKVKRLFYIIKALSKERPHIVHSWSSYANFYAATGGWLAGIPGRLGSERGNPIYSKRLSGKLIYFLSFLGLDALIVNNELAIDSLKKENPRLKIVYIPNGVSIDEDLLSKKDARRFLTIPDEGMVIAGIGSLLPNKNFEYLIRIFRKICLLNSLTKLIIIGDGPKRIDLMKQADQDLPPGRFHFLGALENAYRYIKAIDVLCVPSFQEGMPNVVMEALAAGIPVIANEVDSIPLLIRNGENGYTVQTGDEESFYLALLKLVESPELRKKMGDLGKKSMEEFSTSKMGDRFVELYKDLIKTKDHGNNLDN